MLFFHKTHICPILLFGNRNERESAVVCRLFNHRHILSIETAYDRHTPLYQRNGIVININKDDIAIDIGKNNVKI